MRSPCLREPVRVFLPLLLLYALDAHGEKTYTLHSSFVTLQFLGFVVQSVYSEAVT